MRVELEVAGHAVNFVSINKYDGVPTQEEMVKHCAFPQLQDTEELDIWGRFGGGKDDFYILDAEGKLHTYLKFWGDVPTNLSEADGYQAVKGAILSALEGKVDPPPARDADSEPDTSDEEEVVAPQADAIASLDSGPEPDAPAPDTTPDDDGTTSSADDVMEPDGD